MVTSRNFGRGCALIGLFGLGLLLRWAYLAEMEFNYDEKYMYLAVQQALDGEAWPILGMPSGAFGIRNPGMSVWIFNLLGWVLQARDPVTLTRGVGFLGVAALALLTFILWKKLPSNSRAAWGWGIAFATVNPFIVSYQRKIWAQSILAFLVVLFLWAYWERRRTAGSFFWGLIGPCLGQIHMSGFFFSAAFALASLRNAEERRRARWGPWFAGSVLGTLPMIPWLFYLPAAPRSGSLAGLLLEFSQLRFWSFWFSDPTGLTLGYLLGQARGSGVWVQNQDFMRYPMLGQGVASYGVAVAMLISFSIALVVFSTAAYRVFRRQWHRLSAEYDPDTHAAVWTAGGLYGLILPFSMAHIRRHYLLVTFPLEYVWFAREALRGLRRFATPVLALLWVVQLAVTLSYLQYIRWNGGSPQGAYGDSYRVQLERGTLGLPEIEAEVRAAAKR